MIWTSVIFRRRCPCGIFGWNRPDSGLEGDRPVRDGRFWPALGSLRVVFSQMAGSCRPVRDRGRAGDLRRDPRAMAIETNAAGRPARRGREGLGGAARRAACRDGRAGRPATVLQRGPDALVIFTQGYARLVPPKSAASRRGGGAWQLRPGSHTRQRASASANGIARILVSNPPGSGWRRINTPHQPSARRLRTSHSVRVRYCG